MFLQTSIIRTQQLRRVEETVLEIAWMIWQLTSNTWHHMVGCLFNRCILFGLFCILLCWLKVCGFRKGAMARILALKKMLCKWKRISPLLESITCETKALTIQLLHWSHSGQEWKKLNGAQQLPVTSMWLIQVNKLLCVKEVYIKEWSPFMHITATQ